MKLSVNRSHSGAGDGLNTYPSSRYWGDLCLRLIIFIIVKQWTSTARYRFFHLKILTIKDLNATRNQLSPKNCAKKMSDLLMLCFIAQVWHSSTSVPQLSSRTIFNMAEPILNGLLLGNKWYCKDSLLRLFVILKKLGYRTKS